MQASKSSLPGTWDSLNVARFSSVLNASIMIAGIEGHYGDAAVAGCHNVSSGHTAHRSRTTG